MESSSGKIALEDVYDLASEIGSEFDRIINQCGNDAVAKLMPKVIRTLEHLEVLTLHKDDADNELDKLKMRIHQLEHEKTEKAENQMKYELEVEQVEESWRKENVELGELIEKLKAENMKLSTSLVNQEDSQSLLELQSQCQSQQNIELIHLKNSMERSNKKVETLSKEIDAKNEEIQKLYDQMEAVMQQNRDLRRRVKHLQLQSRQLADDKTDLQVKIQDQGKELNLLQEQMNKNCEETKQLKSQESPSKIPKFTLNELRTIIFDRNDLKARVSELSDEIAYLKKFNSNSNGLPKNLDLLDIEDVEEDLPVQGPINREPEDKLFPEKNATKILKFFPMNWSRLTKINQK